MLLVMKGFYVENKVLYDGSTKLTTEGAERDRNQQTLFTETVILV